MDTSYPNGIYLRWATFIKTIPLPQGLKAKLCAEYQESARKNVQRSFGVLQAHFAISYDPFEVWIRLNYVSNGNVCYTPQMIVEDKHDSYSLAYDYDAVEDNIPASNINGTIICAM